MTTDDAPPRVELGPGYDVPRVLVGCWQLSGGHGRWPDGSAPLDRLLELAEAGFDTFDCADIYTGVEVALGELRRRAATVSTRPRIQVHTKLVPDRAELPRLGRARVEAIVDRSLARLGAERLDLVQLHWWDFDVPGWIETAVWLDELRRAGKVRNVGTTNFDAARLEVLLDAGVPVVSNQVQYSVLDRRPGDRLTDLCRARGVALVAYGALAGGFLSDAWLGRDDPGPAPGNRSLVKYRLIVDEAGAWADLQRLLAALAAGPGGPDAIAAEAVAWVLGRPAVAAVVSGLSPRTTPEACRALLVPLHPERRAAIEAAAAALRPLPGDVYALEREPGGRHAVIMKTDLHRRDDAP